jgi:phosphoribosyl-ATP pyrophosphohydrolase/phosphoribosyl-AMP cyclohydrolase
MLNSDELKWDHSGLMPAVVQDAASGDVLMLAYVSRESLQRTRELGETVFYSRGRQALWHKGETSGNTQKVVGLQADCDADAILIRVCPRGPACHTGARSCFFESVEGFESGPPDSIGAIVSELEQVIAQRNAERPEGSYTAGLFERGHRRIMQKVGEEAVETVIAGMGSNRDEFISEAADLIFHLLVALRDQGVTTSDIARELRIRRLSGKATK